jgi:hypothetical protein
MKRFASTIQKPLSLLNGHLTTCIADATYNHADGFTFINPCTDKTYIGFWPDDCLYPYLAQPEIFDKENGEKLLAFLADSIIELAYVPDRIEPDGTPVMSPGQKDTPHTDRMPHHLPAAWTRVLSCFEQWGAAIPEKKAWAQVITRSFEQVPFENGLVYNDPQNPNVGYGFYDTVAITGMELMSSLMLYKGFLRAADLFADTAEPAIVQQWRAKAQAIRDNLHRLYDENIGGYVAGSVDCRQFSVWGNGLAYWLSSEGQKRIIAATWKKLAGKIFKSGFTRQIAEDSGWQRMLIPGYSAGQYMNGGYWPVGTAYIIGALAKHSLKLAENLAEELAENVERFKYAEWISPDGKECGAKGFIGSLALPVVALRAAVDKTPLLSVF